MSTHLESLLEQSASTSRFHSASRYHAAPILSLVDRDGREVLYVARRFVPEPDLSNAVPHRVTEGQRPDHVAHEHLSDSEKFWELCDLNLERRPWTLTQLPGNAILVPAEGSSASNAQFFPM